MNGRKSRAAHKTYKLLVVNYKMINSYTNIYVILYFSTHNNSCFVKCIDSIFLGFSIGYYGLNLKWVKKSYIDQKYCVDVKIIVDHNNRCEGCNFSVNHI